MEQRRVIQVTGRSSQFSITPPNNLIRIDTTYYRVVGRPSEHELELVADDRAWTEPVPWQPRSPSDYRGVHEERRR